MGIIYFSTLEPNIIYVIALGEQTIKEAEIARKNMQ